MTAALEGGEGSASRPGRSLPPGKTRYPLYRRLGGPQGQSGQVRKISPPPGFNHRTVQPVASRYTDYATLPTSTVIPCTNSHTKSCVTIVITCTFKRTFELAKQVKCVSHAQHFENYRIQGNSKHWFRTSITTETNSTKTSSTWGVVKDFLNPFAPELNFPGTLRKTGV